MNGGSPNSDMTGHAPSRTHPGRRLVVQGVLLTAMALLMLRVVDLHVVRRDFLQGQGDARYLRVVSVAAHRGMITDRRGEPLAVSTPVDSIWANPQDLVMARDQWSRLARLLGMNIDHLQRRLSSRDDREFVYLRRRVNPELARRVMELGIPGISLQREYRRYYPAAEVAAHVVGFTDVDDAGQEGLELAFDDWLRSVPGSKRVIKDRLGHVVQDVESIQEPKPGKDLALSIDRRIQYLAYRELKAAVKRHQARSASAVMIDVRSGEVLAMVNQPAYNPNKRSELRGSRYRNRAVTDVFEPGSTVKPFTVAAALESGKYHPRTVIDTTPGWFMVGNKTIQDIHNYGVIDVATVIKKSSNVGATKMALAIEPQRLWGVFSGVGFGAVAGSGFPGESPGLLSDYRRWRQLEQATHAFGYGLSVTALQLARAYGVLAGDGQLRPVSFQRVDEPAPGRRVMPARIARQMRDMLEAATEDGGTGQAARIPGYRVAGKTGTARKSGIGGYAEDRHVALFAGMAPASRPRLVMVVMINEPSAGEYYGGQVAGPVFAAVMAGALRLLGVAPDDLPALDLRVAQGHDSGAASSAAGGESPARPLTEAPL